MPPVFSNPLFEELYKKDFFIDQDILIDILAMGDKAIPELEKIVEDVIENFDQYEERSWNENFFFIHALYLLYELDAQQSLPLLLKIAAQPTDFQEYWFSDSMYEDLPELIAKLGRNQIEVCQAFVQNRKYSLHSRNFATKALTLMAVVYPEKREQIVSFYRNYLHHFINNHQKIEELYPEDEEEYGYSIYEYISFLLLDLQEHNMVELEPEIRECYRKELVDEFVAGEEENITFDSKEPALISGISEKYKQFHKFYAEDSPFHPDAAQISLRKQAEAEKARLEMEAWEKSLSSKKKALPSNVVPVTTSPKVGRNDPCPCGSGKKYKKCCME